jgi:hypothetical protein
MSNENLSRPVSVSDELHKLAEKWNKEGYEKDSAASSREEQWQSSTLWDCAYQLKQVASALEADRAGRGVVPDAINLDDVEVDLALDKVLRASGSRLANYSMHKTIQDMRAAMREAMLAQGQGGVRDGFIAMPLLRPDEMQALRRFAETAEDDESYDVPKDMMAFLAINGAVSRSPTRKNWYWLTDYGRMLLAASPQPDAEGGV